MRYIVFENNSTYYDSIVMVCNKDLKTVKPEPSIKSGYGGYTVHEASGGYVFESLPLLRHFFQGARDVFGEGYSVYGSPTYEEKQEKHSLTYWIWNFLRAKKIKKEMIRFGGMNADMYLEAPDDYTFVMFLDYLEEVDKEEYLRQLKLVEEQRIKTIQAEKDWAKGIKKENK